MDKLINYRILIESDRDKAREFYQEQFLSDEPLSARSVHQEQHEALEALTDQIMDDSIRSHVSIIATVTDTNTIIGIGLNVPSSISDPNFYTIPEKYQDEVANEERIDQKLFHDIHNGINVFEMFGETEAVHIYAVAVDRKYRCKGIGSELIKQTFIAAKNLGQRMAFTEVSNNYSRKMFNKLGFRQLKEIKFEDYYGEKLNTGEHRSLTLHAISF